GDPISGHIMAHAWNYLIYSPPTGTFFGSYNGGAAYLDLTVEMERDVSGFWYTTSGSEINDSTNFLRGMIRYIANDSLGTIIAKTSTAANLNMNNANGSIWERPQTIYSPTGGYNSGLIINAPI